MTLADFAAVIDVHLKGSWLCTRAAAEVMRGRGGAIVNMSSMSTEAMPPEVFARFEMETPLGRAGEPSEVAGAVLEVGGGRRM